MVKSVIISDGDFELVFNSKSHKFEVLEIETLKNSFVKYVSAENLFKKLVKQRDSLKKLAEKKVKLEELKRKRTLEKEKISFHLKNPKEFLSFFKNLKEFVSETDIFLSDKGLTINMMDAANVSMVSVSFDKSYFDSFKCKKGFEKFTLLNVVKLVQLFKYMSSEITFCFNKEELVIEGLNGINSKATIELFEASNVKKLPDLTFETKLEVETKGLKKAIDLMNNLGESCEFSSSKKSYLTLKAKEEKDSVEAKILNVYPILVGNSKSRYSVGYLQKMISFFKDVDKFLLMYGTDYPLAFVMTDDKESKFKLTFILAPRIEGD